MHSKNCHTLRTLLTYPLSVLAAGLEPIVPSAPLLPTCLALAKLAMQNAHCSGLTVLNDYALLHSRRPAYVCEFKQTKNIKFCPEDAFSAFFSIPKIRLHLIRPKLLAQCFSQK